MSRVQEIYEGMELQRQADSPHLIIQFRFSILLSEKEWNMNTEAGRKAIIQGRLERAIREIDDRQRTGTDTGGDNDRRGSAGE